MSPGKAMSKKYRGSGSLGIGPPVAQQLPHNISQFPPFSSEKPKTASFHKPQKQSEQAKINLSHINHARWETLAINSVILISSHADIELCEACLSISIFFSRKQPARNEFCHLRSGPWNLFYPSRSGLKCLAIWFTAHVNWFPVSLFMSSNINSPRLSRLKVNTKWTSWFDEDILVAPFLCKIWLTVSDHSLGRRCFDGQVYWNEIVFPRASDVRWTGNDIAGNLGIENAFISVFSSITL